MSHIFQSSYKEQIALSHVTGVTPIHINLRSDAGAGAPNPYTLWPVADTEYTFLSANMSTPYITSTSANDAAAGTGARTVSISGMDATGAIQSETLTLNGTASVNLVNSYVTINSMTVATVGSGKRAAGNVHIGTGVNTAGTPAVIHGKIATGFNKSASSIYAVPSGYKLLIKDLSVVSSNNSGAGADLRLVTSEAAGPLVEQLFGGVNSTGQGFVYCSESPIVIPELTQMMILCAGVSITLEGFISGWLINTSTSVAY